ncbi:glycine zipper 2TM domain-containing protein [Solilutibacter silvestris]|uniref:Glycine zipper 2TM domain-containing protein n=1 Tax=Solilutibacter silvestris TaxID=1645665 RepID=A0A2K1PYB9_9GAMM|nr:glycine zipper 2TM domain-containing protein [Lysobacter silvestris]PNS07784.1 Glycine zipper 2TM domain-containing protein [Lysobacter silvestris]
MNIDNKVLGAGLGCLLLGGGAVAAYHAATSQPAAPVTAATPATTAQPASGTTALQPTAADSASNAVHGDAASNASDYAPIIGVQKVSSKSTRYATVLDVTPVNDKIAQNTPRQDCRDVVVNEPAPTRDPHNVAGSAIGAVVGGLVGHQIGGGKGRDLATVAGAVGGGIAGNRIENRRHANATVQRVDRQCSTVNDTSYKNKLIGYDVTYRNPDGSVGKQRMGSRPGSRIAVGTGTQTDGYDVTYRYEGKDKVVRLDQRPATDRFPVVDGRVVTRL